MFVMVFGCGNNEFFYVKLKTFELECYTIHIMKQTNIIITENYLNILKQAKVPVSFKNLSVTSSGICFHILHEVAR